MGYAKAVETELNALLVPALERVLRSAPPQSTEEWGVTFPFAPLFLSGPHPCGRENDLRCGEAALAPP